MSMVELIPNNEKTAQWTIMGTTTILSGKQDVPVESMMNTTFDQAEKVASNRTLTLIDKKDRTEKIHGYYLK